MVRREEISGPLGLGFDGGITSLLGGRGLPRGGGGGVLSCEGSL